MGSPRPDALTTRERVSHASQPLLRWKKTEAKYSSAIYFLSIPVPVSNPIKFYPQRICQRSQSLVRRSTQAQHFYDLKKLKEKSHGYNHCRRNNIWKQKRRNMD